MPNDAKLGLLVGVLGVVLAAAVSADRTPPPTGHAAAGEPATTAPADPKPAAPAALPADLGTTPAARGRPEPEGTPAGRKPRRDEP
jgi:hypothetical protein